MDMAIFPILPSVLVGNFSFRISLRSSGSWGGVIFNVITIDDRQLDISLTDGFAQPLYESDVTNAENACF